MMVSVRILDLGARSSDHKHSPPTPGIEAKYPSPNKLLSLYVGMPFRWAYLFTVSVTLTRNIKTD